MLKVAWRNLWRNRTRTLITASAIALTYGLYLFMVGIQEFTYGQMEEAAAQAAGGAVLVQGEGFQDSQLNDILIDEPDATMASLAALPGVEAVSGRVIVDGLASTSASSSPLRLQGVDPVAEREFQDLSEYLTEGTYLTGDEKDPIVLGRSIVEELELELGDRVIVTATDPTGEMRRSLFHLTGVLTTGSKLTDSSLAFTTIPAARNALGAEDALSQVGLLVSVTPDEVAESARAALADRDELEVLTWAEAMPDLVGFIEMDRAYGDVFAIVLFLVVLLAIMNTFLMVVMERVRELGLLSAIGLTPRRLGTLVLLETLFLALVAMAAGLAIGLAAHTATAHYGIDMTAMYGDQLDVAGVALTDTMIYSVIDVGRWVGSSVNVLLMVLLSAAYPAYKAMRMQPADAMRFYE